MNGPDWSSFEADVQSAHSDMFNFPTVGVHNFSGGYDEATGETHDWTDDGGTDVVAEPTNPENPMMTTGPDGQTREVERVFRFRTDESVTLESVGTETRPTEIAYDGSRWVVTAVNDEGNGLYAVLTVEA